MDNKKEPKKLSRRDLLSGAGKAVVGAMVANAATDALASENEGTNKPSFPPKYKKEYLPQTKEYRITMLDANGKVLKDAAGDEIIEVDDDDDFAYRIALARARGALVHSQCGKTETKDGKTTTSSRGRIVGSQIICD